MADKPTSLPGLLDEEYIACYPSLAVRTGVNRALLLQRLHFLVKITEKSKNEKHYFEGRYWVYNTYASWRDDYFPWLDVGTIKRLFLDLEKQGIVLSRTEPHPKNGAEMVKWYTIRYEFWAEWLEGAAQKETGGGRHKKRRPPAQKETPPVLKRDGGAESIETPPVLKRDDPIYKDSERLSIDLQNNPIESAASTPLESVDSSAQNAAAAADPDDWTLIEKDIYGLKLPPATIERLKQHGAVTALAIWLETQQPHVQNPAGLAITLIDEPSKLSLKAFEDAEQSLKYRRSVLTGKPEGEIEIAAHNARALAGDPAQAALPALVEESPPGEAADPLDQPLWPGRRGTARIAFLSARARYAIHSSDQAALEWLQAAAPVRFKDGVLTVQAGPGSFDFAKKAVDNHIRGATGEKIARVEWLEAVAV